MPVETLSATLPLAMSVAAIAGGRLRERRRREGLNRAIHELRRPLQALALMSADRGRLEPVLGALDDLDRAVNGAPPPTGRRPLEARPIVELALRRCAPPAPGAGPRPRPSLLWSAGQAVVVGDRPQLVRAVENLLANALEHGRAPVDVVALARRGRLRILVRDGGAPARPARRRPADPRRGHGLRIVREVAAAHGGRFVLRSSSSLTIAALDLPLAPRLRAAGGAAGEEPAAHHPPPLDPAA